MNNYQHNQNQITQAAVASIAAASETPFKTAFKIYLGMALASVATFFIVISGFAVLGVIGAWLLK